MEVPSLRKLSIDAAIATLKNINSVGDLNYETVRPVLLKVESAKQLYAIEQNSPQIIGEDVELWRAFIRRDVPQLDRARRVVNKTLRNPARYYDLYRSLVEEQEADTKVEAEKLKAVLQEKKAAKEANTVEMISGPVAYKETGRRAGPLATGSPPKHSALGSSLETRKGGKTVKVSGTAMLAKFRKESAANPRFRERDMRSRKDRNAPAPVPRRSPTTSKSPTDSPVSRSPAGGAPAGTGTKRKAEELDEGAAATTPAASGSSATAAGRRPIANPAPRRPAGVAGMPSFMLPNKRQK